VIPQAPAPFCWAACLGDCSEDFSQEHVLSRSTFAGPEISVQGFPFQAGEVLTLHKNQFSTNTLCRYHNNNLSSVDQAGTNAFNVFLNAASDTPRPKNTIRGDTFERWLLKTAINIELLANFKTPIPSELVEIAFGHRPFPASSGLFFMGNTQDTVIPEDRITVMRLHDPINNGVPAVQFTVGGFRLLLAYGPFMAHGRPIHLKHRNGTTDTTRVIHHPERFDFRSGNLLRIDWRKQLNRTLLANDKKQNPSG
jgi:hypothetical protein